MSKKNKTIAVAPATTYKTLTVKFNKAKMSMKPMMKVVISTLRMIVRVKL